MPQQHLPAMTETPLIKCFPPSLHHLPPTSPLLVTSLQCAAMTAYGYAGRSRSFYFSDLKLIYAQKISPPIFRLLGQAWLVAASFCWSYVVRERGCLKQKPSIMIDRFVRSVSPPTNVLCCLVSLSNKEMGRGRRLQ